MTGKGKISDLDALFRDSLESAELVPSEGLYRSITRKVAIRKFFSFNASSLNIWYTAAAAIAVVTASILLTGNENVVVPEREGITIIDSAEFENSVSGVVDTIAQAGGPEKTVKAVSPGQKRLTGGGDARSDSRRISSPDSTTEYHKSGSETIPARLFTASGNHLQKQTGETTLTVSRFAPSTWSGCQPLAVNFKNNSLNFDSCIWTFGDGGTSTDSNAGWLYDESGEFMVTLTVFDKERKPHQSQVKITVYPQPAARFEISESRTEGTVEGIKFINLSSGASKYRWNFGDGDVSDKYEPLHRFQKSGTYSVTLHAISIYGCVDSLQLREEFKGNGYFINFPNALMANPGGPTGGYYSVASDQTGSVFHPVSAGIADYSLKVYSKRGVLLFETDDINIGWDGYYKGQLCEAGVYVWKVRGRYRNGESFVKIGDLTLFKQ